MARKSKIETHELQFSLDLMRAGFGYLKTEDEIKDKIRVLTQRRRLENVNIYEQTVDHVGGRKTLICTITGERTPLIRRGKAYLRADVGPHRGSFRHKGLKRAVKDELFHCRVASEGPVPRSYYMRKP